MATLTLAIGITENPTQTGQNVRDVLSQFLDTWGSVWKGPIQDLLISRIPPAGSPLSALGAYKGSCRGASHTFAPVDPAHVLLFRRCLD